MATKTRQMIQALRETAHNLSHGSSYQWGHMGSCNCGHLAQVVTHHSKGEIHGAAMWRYGDWREQLRDYCPTSGLPLDAIIDQMLDFGFSRSALAHLERLSDPTVLEHVPTNLKPLQHNKLEHVVAYLDAWAIALVESVLLEVIDKIEVAQRELLEPELI